MSTLAVLVPGISSNFTIGTFLFRLVRRFAMGSMWIDFVCSLTVHAMQAMAALKSISRRIFAI